MNFIPTIQLNPVLFDGLQWVEAFFCSTAFVMSLAVRRSQLHTEPPMMDMGRSIVTGGFFFLMVRIFWLALFNNDQSSFTPLGMMAILFITMGTTIILASRILQEDAKLVCEACPYKTVNDPSGFAPTVHLSREAMRPYHE